MGGWGLSVAAELGGGRTCWLVEWPGRACRGWVLAPSTSGADHITRQLDRFVERYGADHVRRQLRTPTEIPDEISDADAGRPQPLAVNLLTDLSATRTCWVVDWADGSPRSWCIVPRGTQAGAVHVLLAEFLDRHESELARRLLSRPVELASDPRGSVTPRG